jgi:hypothetical protein
MDPDRIRALVPELYRLVAELEDAAPGRPFAPDGHLLGSIEEVLAAARYGLTLTTASTKGKDATAPDGREVEIKTTAGKVIALRGDPPRHLLVLLLGKDGTSETIYNGPGWVVWEQAGKSNNRNGQRQISLARLKQLQGLVPYGETLLAVEGGSQRNGSAAPRACLRPPLTSMPAAGWWR